MFYFSGDRVTRSFALCVMFYFSGVRVTRSLVLCVMFYFSGVCVTRSLVLCVSSCSTSGTRRVNLVTNPVTSMFLFLNYFSSVICFMENCC
jgi:hypothetical protein